MEGFDVIGGFRGLSSVEEDTGIVDEEVNVADVGFDLVDDGEKIGLGGDVCFEGDDFAEFLEGG